MRKFFRFIFKLILICAIVLAGTIALNNETDVLLNFNRYVPQAEKYPQIAQQLNDISVRLSEHTGNIPTIEKLMANVRKYTMGAEDIATNEYIKDSPLLSFYPKETIGIKVNDEYITVYGNTNDEEKINFIGQFTDEKGKELSQTSFSSDFQNEFAKKINFPQTEKNRIQLSVYYCRKVYGEYRSWVIDYLYFVRKGDGVWSLEKSSVYNSNRELFEQDKSISAATGASSDILSSNESIIALTQQIISGAANDYEKVVSIHDWICNNIYYDQDSLTSGKYPQYNPIDVINNRSGVCKGFAYLFATMTRSIGIPCNIVSGYALGIDGVDSWEKVTDSRTQNHAWNEAYVDGRWIIVDTTWDCGNKIENGKKVQEGTSHIYFDANLQYFSANHKAMQYIFK